MRYAQPLLPADAFGAAEVKRSGTKSDDLDGRYLEIWLSA